MRLVSNAKEIIIIGFGFDRTNLDMLGFPKGAEAKDMSVLFENKTIRILNYNGQMTTLEEQREVIRQRVSTADIKISTNKKISLAYQNDFKTQFHGKC